MGNNVDLTKYKDELISFKAGEVIFNNNEPGNVMYLITKGDVEISIHDKVVENVSPGGVIGEMALLDMGPRSATATARTDCLLLAIDRERFKVQVGKSPSFALQVMRIMAERLRRVNKFIP
jgi:CRP/FNR family transcriptional regulator, cyclic AMP receptor protein